MGRQEGLLFPRGLRVTNLGLFWQFWGWGEIWSAVAWPTQTHSAGIPGFLCPNPAWPEIWIPPASWPRPGSPASPGLWMWNPKIWGPSMYIWCKYVHICI